MLPIEQHRPGIHIFKEIIRSSMQMLTSINSQMTGGMGGSYIIFCTFLIRLRCFMIKTFYYYLNEFCFQKQYHQCRTHLSESKAVAGCLTSMNYLVMREQLPINIHLNSTCQLQISFVQPCSSFLTKSYRLNPPK